MRRLELLAPAKDLSVGVAAIDCGADAVYIGAEKFSARAAAGNSLNDIAALADYAHQFGAKVYVALNTLIHDEEKDELLSLLSSLREIDIDALLIQDPALLPLTRSWAIPLHASTQMDNRSVERVEWLKEQGFARVVLARELSLEQIRTIHEAQPDIELEAFVHGALCVSYSGACYASEYLFDRSANRGRCAQVCRMKFDLIDSRGTVLKKASHLLSLKDLCLIDHLEELADAGVTSFKIEGRLKDITYVKNVVSAYSQQLNELCARRQGDYQRSSEGVVDYSFTPDLSKTFNRGYTEYFFSRRERDIYSPATPKAMGACVGVVKEVYSRALTVSSIASFVNGDGLCFINESGELEGFRVNRAEGNKLYPFAMPKDIKKGVALFRNSDMAFEKLLAKRVAARHIPLALTYSLSPKGFTLRAEVCGRSVQSSVTYPHEPALKPQGENIREQVSRWGGTIYKVVSVTIEGDADKYFLPASLLSVLRHSLAQTLAQTLTHSVLTSDRGGEGAAVEFVESAEGEHTAEDKAWSEGMPLMQCKHCLRYALGYCVKHGGARPVWYEPLYLRMTDGRRMRLTFDCDKCMILLWRAD